MSYEIINASEVLANDLSCSECGCNAETKLYLVDGEYYCEDCFRREFVECARCGELIRRDDATDTNDGYVCEECLDLHYAFCEDCETYYDVDEMNYIDSEERYVCDNCLDENYTRCERCGEWHRNDDMYTVIVDEEGSTEEWCQSCSDWNTWICDECGNRFSDDVEREYDGDECICLECAGSRGQDTGDINTWRAPRGVRNYSYKPDPCFCETEDERGIDNLVRYGFELEVDKPTDGDATTFADFVNDTSGYTYCKHDGSLDSSEAFEIVSHPATLAYHMSKKDTWEQIFNQLITDGGYKSHDAKTCGLHVHISLKPLEDASPCTIGNMLFLMDHFWDRFVKFSRRTEAQLSHWARRYSGFHGDHEDWKRQAKDTRDRYYALNLQNRHTVEIRMFRGTLNIETFIATLQFVDTFVKRCMEIGGDMSKLQSMDWETLVHSDYPELNAYLKRRGLTGTEEELAEIERKAEEAKRRKEQEDIERQNRLLEERRRRMEDREREFLERIYPLHIGARVEVVSAPDGFNALIGHTGIITTIRHNSFLPIEVDFSDELPDGYISGMRSLHTANEADLFDNRRTFWWCPTESLRIVADNNTQSN